MVDRSPLHLVQGLVQASLEARTGRVPAERRPVDDQRDVDKVRIGRAAVLLHGQLHDRIAAVVQETLDPGQLALGVPADSLGDLDVLALDDRPHGGTSVERSSGPQAL